MTLFHDWILWVGFLFAEFGSFLATDYYFYRRHRGLITETRTLTQDISPPQLTLKGAWGSYLFAFLFLLITMIRLAERGWPISLFALVYFFISYYEGADPFFWRKKKWASILTSVGGTWIPFVTGVLIGNSIPTGISICGITVLYLGRIVYSLKEPRFNS